MRRTLIAFALLIAALPLHGRSNPVTITPGSPVRAGYGQVDSTWRVGAGAGQYSAKDPNLAHAVQGNQADPYNHSWTQRRSYGVHSRLSFRAIVVEGANGRRVALVKSDHYLASDALARRAAQILDASGTSGVGYEDILLMASHNHSSPFYYSPSWGPWLFQDLFDLRAFEYEARNFAKAIELAAADLRPARMGATTVEHTIYKGQIARATIGDDGSPAGYPESHADFGLSVLRFEEHPSGTPIAAFVNFGQHPESLDGYDLITADFLAPLERMVERDLGAPLVWSQGDVGSAEGPYFGGNDVLPDGVVRAWAHVGHAQTERGARYLADSIVDAWHRIGRGEGSVPLSPSFPVDMAEAWVPGPVSHPYASVSNCRTEPTVEGNPGSPIVGLPDCGRAGRTDQTNPTWETLKESGVPLPEHYDAPSWGAVEENQRLRLQAVRLGEVVLASCSCEAQMDLILNFESRADDVEGNIFDGYEYPCTQNPNATWTCKAGAKLDLNVTISDAKHKRMVAQIHNDAKGWDDVENAVESNTEPADPAKIRGNFTKQELPASLGYTLPIGVGMAAEYQGYVVSYREYMIRDHYRKALTAYGPHTADYMVTRMVRLAALLKGGPALPDEPLQAHATVDEMRQTVFTAVLGAMSSATYDAWVAALPNDAWAAAGVQQPVDVTRFQAATFRWRGGSNAVDNPLVRVERKVGGQWVPYADQTGEVQTMVTFPAGADALADSYTGAREWIWTANFEAFDAFPATVIDGGQTPDGEYRFVVQGTRRSGGADVPYHLASDSFLVGPWRGITVSDSRREAGGDVSFVVDPIRYPRTYASGFRYIRDDGNQTLCKTCTFRPWASRGTVASAAVYVDRLVGPDEVVPATLQNGRWVAAAGVLPGDVVTIRPGDVRDAFGEINGSSLTF
ncbi:MAG TPA: neutral/alkaline non-lysosomal ceramidase N-terminal domain-containing protein [Actinomycetota bacterium]|nr:neutral/alkaline non-lysosomal ceramidase N-terminal domain-containing protein [Actinomycetota bacterium]